MPRWVFLLGVGLLLVALAFVVTCAVLGPSPGITEANVRRIKPGMKPAEVEALLGGRPARMTIESWADEMGLLWPDPGVWVWDGATGSARVRVDVTGRVESARWVRHGPGPSLLDRLRKQAGL